MSSCGIDVSSEQLCYIPCDFCSIVLAVSVPCSSLFDIVTVRCGHCANLWSVNMAAAAFHSLSTTAWQIQQQQQQQQNQQQQAQNYASPTNQRLENQNGTMGSSSSRYHYNRKVGVRAAAATGANPTQERVVNRPPEKRQRVPSAYNQFIKEEIQRIKANNPDISHREAFSTAAKNWAHFPHIHFGLMLENNQAKLNERTGLLIFDEVLETVELLDIKDSLVGMPGENGLSTEQRKKLTLAVELVANPSIVFMDEPTTGLDARAAAIVMRVVKNVAETGRTVVCTIHQPSIDIFEAFDEPQHILREFVRKQQAICKWKTLVAKHI